MSWSTMVDTQAPVHVRTKPKQSAADIILGRLVLTLLSPSSCNATITPSFEYGEYLLYKNLKSGSIERNISKSKPVIVIKRWSLPDSKTCLALEEVKHNVAVVWKVPYKTSSDTVNEQIDCDQGHPFAWQ